MGLQVAMFVFSMAMSAMQRQKQKKAQKKMQKRLQQMQGAGHLINTRDTQEPRPIIYGTMKVGVAEVDMHSTGDNWNYLHHISDFGMGELDSIVNLYLDEKPSTDFGSDCYYEFFSGGINQNVCTTYQGYKSTWNDNRRGYAYLYLRLKWNRNSFTGNPIITAVVKGLKVLDTRTSTTAWSDNPALCWYDLMTNPRYGAGLPTSMFDTASISAAANWCDTKGYKCNAVIKDRSHAMDISDKLLMSARLEMVYTGSVYKLLPLDYDSPVMNLTEDDIVADSWVIEAPSVADRPNTLKVKYIDKDKSYVKADLIVSDLTSINLDGETREEEIDLIGCSSMSQALKIAAYEADRRRLDRRHTFSAGIKAQQLEPGDMINVKHTLPGWTTGTGQRCRVIETDTLADDTVSLTVVEESAALYDDTINMTTQVSYTSNLPNPLAAPPSVANVSITEEQVTVKDNTHARVKLSWTAATNYPFLDYAEVWISRDAGATYLHHTDGDLSAGIEPAKDGDQLYIKILAVSIQGMRQTLADVSAYQYTVTGKTSVPSDVTGFQATAAGDNVHLRWEPFSDFTDHSFYELRYGASFGSSLFFALTKAVNVDRPGVKPGTHTFCIKAKDTLGNYSANAAVNTVIVGNPIGYASDTSFGPNNYGTGTHSNTEQYNDPTYGYVLRVTHGGGLSGNYTSPQYDLGSIKTDRLWSVFETVIQAAGATWQGGVGDVNWNTVLAAGETWIQQFANVQAGILKMELLYSENGTDWYTATGFELLSIEVQARYLKYKIYITDNDSSSYIYVKPTTLQVWRRA